LIHYISKGVIGGKTYNNMFGQMGWFFTRRNVRNDDRKGERKLELPKGRSSKAASIAKSVGKALARFFRGVRRFVIFMTPYTAKFLKGLAITVFWIVRIVLKVVWFTLKALGGIITFVWSIASAPSTAPSRPVREKPSNTITHSERRASSPSCPNCGKPAPGGVIAGNRITHCLSCGGTFCSQCAGGGLVFRTCPFCGENSQKKIRFGDTGTNW